MIIIFGLIAILIAADLTMPEQFGATPVHEDGPPPLVLFCKTDACAMTLSSLIYNSTTVDCALYDLGHPLVIAALIKKIESNSSVRIVLDDRSVRKEKHSAHSLKSEHIRIDTPDGQMHNKFCIFNENIVLSGSFNPTTRGDLSNDNNVIIISSPALARSFSDEFEELWNGVYRGGKKTRQSRVEMENATIEVLFCPEDGCANRVIDVLRTANESIRFMTFSFTHDGIAQAIISAKDRGVDAQGIMEKSGNKKISVYDELTTAGIEVTYDSNPAMMHHKVFIIDSSIVITGSFNPTQNGDRRNDENILIIHNDHIAKLFEAEYARILSP